MIFSLRIAAPFIAAVLLYGCAGGMPHANQAQTPPDNKAAFGMYRDGEAFYIRSDMLGKAGVTPPEGKTKISYIRTLEDKMLLRPTGDTAPLTDEERTKLYDKASQNALAQLCGGKLKGGFTEGKTPRDTYLNMLYASAGDSLKKQAAPLLQGAKNCAVMTLPAESGLRYGDNGASIPSGKLPHIILPPPPGAAKRLKDNLARVKKLMIMTGSDAVTSLPVTPSDMEILNKGTEEERKDIKRRAIERYERALIEDSGDAYAHGRRAGLYLHCGGNWGHAAAQDYLRRLQRETPQTAAHMYKQTLYIDVAEQSKKIFAKLIGPCRLRP